MNRELLLGAAAIYTSRVLSQVSALFIVYRMSLMPINMLIDGTKDAVGVMNNAFNRTARPLQLTRSYRQIGLDLLSFNGRRTSTGLD